MAKDWPLISIAACCDILDNRRVPVNSEERGGRLGNIPYYGANGIQGYIDKHIFDEPLILIAEDGGYFDEYQSRPIAYRVEGKSWVNNHAHVLRCKADVGFVQDFVFYCLEHKNITPFIKGGTRAKLNQAELREVMIPSPSRDQQQRITEILTTIDEAIAHTEALIAKTQQIKAGLMHDLFTRGVTPDGRLRPPRAEVPKLYKESPLGWIPKEWDAQLLDSITTRGSGHTPSQSHSEYWNGGVKWLSLADSWRLDQTFVQDTDKKISAAGLANSSAVLLPAGTVVVSRDGSRLGKSGILEVTMAVSQHFIAWSCAPAIDNVFLYWTLQHRKREFENVATGSTIPTIGLQFFKRFKIACPREINEQQTIGRMLLAAYDEVVGLVQGKEKLSLIKAGLMHDLLTGRVPVPVGDSQKAAVRV